VWKIVPTLTSKSAEIYLSMAGAKQLVTLGLSRFWSGPYVQQWCARGTILCCTVVLAEGGGVTSEVPEVLIEASANIVEKAESVWVNALSLLLHLADPDSGGASWRALCRPRSGFEGAGVEIFR
jgi:hypothetical protein